MSHELEIVNGQAQMLYVGDKPWHGLGVMLDSPPTPEDAIVLAGLDWEVVKTQLVIEHTGAQVPAFANVRKTDSSVLGIVGPTYKPLQNIDAFKWFRPFLDCNEVSIETAGSLRNGKHIWILAKINRDPVEVVPNDPISQYILLSNSHNGTAAVRAGFTGVRVVCQNTIEAAHNSDNSKLLKVRHTDSTISALDDVREAMDVAHSNFVATAEWMKQMARKGVTVETLKEYVTEVFAPAITFKSEEELSNKMDKQLAKIIPLFENGKGSNIPGVKGTMWGAYNAVTEFLTWERGRSADTRLESLWLGPAGNIAKRAYTAAAKMAA